MFILAMGNLTQGSRNVGAPPQGLWGLFTSLAAEDRLAGWLVYPQAGGRRLDTH